MVTSIMVSMMCFQNHTFYRGFPAMDHPKCQGHSSALTRRSHQKPYIVDNRQQAFNHCHQMMKPGLQSFEASFLYL